MKNKSEQQLLSELVDLNKRTAELRKEIDKRGRESDLKSLKKYVGNCYRDTKFRKGNYCHILYIDKNFQLTGTVLHKYGSKYFTLEFNETIHTNEDNTYNNLKKIPKEKWNDIIKGLQPEIDKGIK